MLAPAPSPSRPDWADYASQILERLRPDKRAQESLWAEDAPQAPADPAATASPEAGDNTGNAVQQTAEPVVGPDAQHILLACRLAATFGSAADFAGCLKPGPSATLVTCSQA